MQYALLSGKKSIPVKGAKGTCPICNAPMVAKCGPRVIHHWAHKTRRNCDPWWENETAWHREWKSYFPESCREVSHTAPDGEVHRADIKTPTGIVIEVQHSALTDSERESRETFYGNLIWIVDGRSFKNRFHIGWMLPDPNADGFEDIVWIRQHIGTMLRFPDSPDTVSHFWRISNERNYYPELTKENMGAMMSPNSLVLVHKGEEIRNQVMANYRSHHQFHWTRPRRTWFDARCPVYIDLGEEVLYQLIQYDDQIGHCVRMVAKQKLIHDAMVESRAKDIATRFYPIA